jgi:parallel beta-helix repeat protein
VTIEGFHIWRANDAGIQFRDGAHSGIVRNNFLFSNDRGVMVRDSAAAQIVNNLVYDNGGGILIDGASAGAVVRNNTVYRNLNGNGVQINAPRARVEYNIIDHNEFNGINLGAQGQSGYVAQYNLLNANREGNWGGSATRGTGSLADVDPLFVDPAGEDGILGGGSLAGQTEYFRDDHFELAHVITGDPADSRAVDHAPISVNEADLDGGTTRRDGIRDSGRLDLGFHYPARPPEVLYVHPTEGSNSNSGLVPERALATIAEALSRAEEGTTVQLFAEEYLESDLRPPAGVTIAGAGMAMTAIDAAGDSFVFDVRSAGVTILDMGVTGATSAGIRSRDDRLRVGNCWIHDNAENGKGIFLLGGANSILFNNVIADNASTGVILGASGSAATKTTIAHNSIVGNGVFGISVGLNSDVDSASTAIVGNVIAENGAVGVSLSRTSAGRLQVDHNCNSDGYAGLAAPPTDIEDDPLLTGQGANGYFLAQVAAGQSTNSPCVDIGATEARRIGLQRGSTRSDRVADAGIADLGFHYDVDTVDFAKVVQVLRDDFLSGDCDGDSRVTVAELVRAIRIALELDPLEGCASLDRDDDGRVGINEIVLAVGQALGE